jgi:predicted AAA+ superfamily ATPase
MLCRSLFAVERLRSSVTMRSIVINPQGVLPYGLSDWTTMRQKECIYVDRTQAIAELDTTAAHACLWGPRRTGKSLLANQLALWHDKAVTEVEVRPSNLDTFFAY